LVALKGSYSFKDEHFVLKCSSPQIDLGELLGLVPSYYYFLKEPSGKVLNFLKKNSEPLVKVNVFFSNMGNLRY
jgi:hypothetical protein